MDLQLNGKKALVSGSTAGIGLSIAARLAAEGADVIVNGRTQERVDQAVEHIRHDHGGATVSGVAADLSTADGAERVFAAVPDVDVLVNNLGIYEAKPFAELTDDDWLNLYKTNVLSGVRLSRHYFPKMLERNRGRLIFIASESALLIPPEMLHYGVTKSAQLSLARGLAEMTKGTAVTVNTVMPGPTRSEGLEPFLAAFAKEKGLSGDEVEPAFFKEMRPSSLLQRLIETDEIADVVAFLASPRSAPISGAPIRAEGGLVQSMA